MSNRQPGTQEIEITAPASIANLGCGFDTLAVAVQLFLRVKARIIPGHGGMEFHFVGQKPSGENNIERAYQHLAGQQWERLPSLAVEVHSDIPMGAGLGSSAAATVAGLRCTMRSQDRCLSKQCSMLHAPWKGIPTMLLLRCWEGLPPAASSTMVRFALRRSRGRPRFDSWC